ncbi:hypothetical protein CKM354_000410100 [Cercospora kikuchii]|uniref:Signal peptide-containing protein n=1 Tax=Cercospora kikuchii TaxID=84275 RepID=A0A9P3CD77_9PEZI|nr:uncharacterized protein CKM354_000410100 [Cercospora kikuchii]GIZ40774.1 hypothetical protein CKM354_000410100 [Cercospora kikuchii]
MAIHRGIQSALFYYLSCAPCADTRYRKRRKREAALSRAERLALETEEFNAYRHPGEPSSTNPHWQSEIELGPTLVRRGKKKVTTADSQRGLQPSRVSSNTSKEPSLADLGYRSGSDARADSRSQFRVHQRDDEDLWGSSSMLDGSMYASSIRRPPTARTAASGSSRYHATRNPAINDMHPPTVTKVDKREDVMWMMQPMPVAEVMSGKERAARSRSDSGASRLSPCSTNLSRQVSTKIIEQKLRAGTPSAAAMSREGSARSAHRANEQRHNAGAEHVLPAIPPEHSRHLSPSRMHAEHSDESSETILRKPELAAVRYIRPELSPVLSDTGLPSSARYLAPKENSLPTPPSSSDGTTDVRDSLVRRSTMAVIDKSGADKARHKHQESELSIRPELFDSWYTPEFELPKWVAEHTKREVRQRWSMDI